SFYKDSIENVPNSIYLSAGNYFSYNSNDKENKIVLDILDSLGYDLISVGKNDLYFTDSIKNVPVVSFNTSGTLPNKTFKLGKMKICITGMIDPENSKYSNKKIISDKDIGEVAQFIDSLKSESDLLIFISNLEAEKEKRIFNEIKNIDIMISNTNQNNEKYSFGERLYISSGSSAEYIGKLSVEKMKEGVKYKNTFTKMKFDVFHEDKNLKTVIDSLKLKYGIDKK
ncbi:MAG: hypothetical protein L6407_03840, partial [Candidatus Delongbacteria bacterium]|nr:hypothetical protein [Candidatus Delongbacteria bacterium]